MKYLLKFSDNEGKTFLFEENSNGYYAVLEDLKIGLL